MPSLYSFTLTPLPSGPLVTMDAKTGIMTVKGKKVEWISPSEVAAVANQMAAQQQRVAMLEAQLAEGSFRLQHAIAMATLLGQVVECDGDINNELMLAIVELLRQYSDMPRKEQIN